MSESAAPDEPVWLHCECTNCTHRWSEPEDGTFLGTIRCPVEDCRSKNVEIWTDDEGEEAA